MNNNEKEQDGQEESEEDEDESDESDESQTDTEEEEEEEESSTSEGETQDIKIRVKKKRVHPRAAKPSKATLKNQNQTLTDKTLKTSVLQARYNRSLNAKLKAPKTGMEQKSSSHLPMSSNGRNSLYIIRTC